MTSLELTAERRKTIRRHCELPVSVETIEIVGNYSWHGHSQDISSYGVCLILSRRYEPGTLVAINIGNNDSPVTLLARVTWVQSLPNGDWVLGCRFSSEVEEGEIRSLLEPPQPPAISIVEARSETLTASDTAHRIDLKSLREKLAALAHHKRGSDTIA
jgi:PilZ domain-containing protein